MNIYVGNLSQLVTDDDLRDFFEPYGTVSSVTIVTDKETGRSRGFGFVEMPDDSEGQFVVWKLRDPELSGQKIIIKESRITLSGGSDSGTGGFGKRPGGGGFRRE